MLIGGVAGARTPAQPAGVDLAIVDGVVAAGPGAVGRPWLDAGGRVVLPAFVDAHVHLDKAYLLGAAERAGLDASDLAGAIAAVRALRDSVPLEAVAAGARRAAEALVRHGTTAARAHVEVEPAVGLDLVGMHQVLAAELAGRIHLQLVAFPQGGLGSRRALDLLQAAMAEGLDVVGGCPYVDDDPVAHVDAVFALAERHGAPVDLHLDFGDDPAASLVDLVADRTAAHGMAGHVTIGHVTTLAAMGPEAQAAALDRLASAGIALVALPATDLHLAGRGGPGGLDGPGSRSVAPVERAVAAGVRTAVANNNVHNPFAPFGNASLLQAAWLAGLTRRAGAPADRAALLDAVTAAPAAILGLPPHGPTPGARAHLAVLDAADPATAVLEAPATLVTVRDGHVVHTLDVPSVGP
jgi:cytosine deaminase